MSILQVHFEIADRWGDLDTFTGEKEGEEVDFQVNVENSENPIQFNAKRQCYYFQESLYEGLDLEPTEIAHRYRYEYLKGGTLKVDYDGRSKSKARQKVTFCQNEIYSKSKDLECYDKIFLIDEDETLPLANLDFTTNWKRVNFFDYCESYITFSDSFTVTLWSGEKKVIHLPKAEDFSFIENSSSVYYRLWFKSIPFGR